MTFARTNFKLVDGEKNIPTFKETDFGIYEDVSF